MFLEMSEGGELLARYTHSGLKTDDVLAVDISNLGATAGLAQQSGSYRFLKDHLGAVRAVASAGNIVQRQHYSSFGELIGVTSADNSQDLRSNAPLKIHFAFTGREFDEETGSYYYRARYYDPSVGRFIEQDPHPGDLINPVSVSNKYTYVGNSPIRYSDPTGKIFGIDDLLFIGLATLIGGFLKDYDEQGGNFFDNFINGAWSGFLSGAALVGIYFGINGVTNIAVNLFKDLSWSTQSMNVFMGVVRDGFNMNTAWGAGIASLVTLAAIPGTFSNVNRFHGLLTATENDRTFANYAAYAGYLTIGAGYNGVPWE